MRASSADELPSCGVDLEADMASQQLEAGIKGRLRMQQVCTLD